MKELNPNRINDIISAEIPNTQNDRKLHDILVRNMVYGPCGVLNPKSPCMKDSKCTKMYPRQLVRETQTATDGYPVYRRRNPTEEGLTALLKSGRKNQDLEIDNRWIVPYSPLLLKMFDAHINVEYCNSVKSIKYILKYVHKGSDQGVFTAQSRDNSVDEIAEYQAGRYISSNEAAWRTFRFPIPKCPNISPGTKQGKSLIVANKVSLSKDMMAFDQAMLLVACTQYI